MMEDTSDSRKRKTCDHQYTIPEIQLTTLRDAHKSYQNIIVLFDPFSAFRIQDIMEKFKQFFRDSNYGIKDTISDKHTITNVFHMRKPSKDGFDLKFVSDTQCIFLPSCTFGIPKEPHCTLALIMNRIPDHDQVKHAMTLASQSFVEGKRVYLLQTELVDCNTAESKIPKVVHT